MSSGTQSATALRASDQMARQGENRLDRNRGRAGDAVCFDTQRAIESVEFVASGLLFSCRVMILWGDPVGESGGGGRTVRVGRRRVRYSRGEILSRGMYSGRDRVNLR